MNKLKLKDVISDEKPNYYVLAYNIYTPKPSKPKEFFCDLYGGLCGTVNGVLLDDSLKSLFKLFKITIKEETKDFLILTQSGISYELPVEYMSEGSFINLPHVDFTRMKEV